MSGFDRLALALAEVSVPPGDRVQQLEVGHAATVLNGGTRTVPGTVRCRFDPCSSHPGDTDQKSMPPGPPAISGVASGLVATTASVVRNKAAIEAAF